MRGPTLVIGIGLGGLFDGIVLHQILQWHHLVSVPVPPVTVDALELNTLADGLFHAAAWVVTAVGVAWLVAASRSDGLPDGAALLGGVFIGWGAFNLAEGVVDHHILNLHHVRPGPDALAYDLGFLAWGGVMLLVGYGLRRWPSSSGRQAFRR